MSIIQMHDALGPYTWLPDFFDEESIAVASHSATSLTLEDANGNAIIFTGTGFIFDGDVPTAGTVTGVTFENGADELLIEVSDGNYRLDNLFNALFNNDLFALFSALKAGKDTIIGSDIGDDILIGSDNGNDVVKGMGGDDYIKGYAGNNRYDGGEDFDTLTYDESIFDKRNAKDGLVLNAVKGTAFNPWGGKDKFEGFEEYFGSHRGDVFKGSNSSEVFAGMNGSDVINGGKGSDRARYDQDRRYNGDDGIRADLDKGRITDGFGKTDRVVSIEQVWGTDSDDKLLGNDAANRFRGRDGVDFFNGRGGEDALVFNAGNIENGINVDLSLSSDQIIDDGYGHTESARSMEAVIGSDFGDTIKLGAADGWVYGSFGEDTLISGSGKHFLEGAEDQDTFVFLDANGIGMQDDAHDIIADFSQDDADLINLSSVGGFDFIGEAAFSGNAVELRFSQQGGNTFVYGDTDADGDADFALELRGEIDLEEQDFVLV